MGIDWMSLPVLAKTGAVFNNLSHFAIGAYFLEVFLSSKFELDVICGRRKFRVGQILYFYCKWILFGAFLGMLVALNVSGPVVNCQALYTWNQYGGNTSIGAASTLLMLRTVAVWNKKWAIIIPLGLISAGQWGILLHGITTVKAFYDPTTNACVVAQVDGLFLNLVYLWTMFTDLIVLILTLVGLLITPGRSQLWKLLLNDGILYFLVAFLVNTVPAVMLLINLNPVMNVMFSIPAVGISSSVACRSFVRLSEFASPVDRSNTSQPWSNANTRVTGRSNRDFGKTSTIQWARPNQTESLGGINVTRSQHVEADNIGLEAYTHSPRNIHPLHNTSGESLDQKGAFAV
ncbi:hypothetical protein PIIN_00712 [Serendipita indica DSM 11827]|uniref:Transmembrane protein n=1 Tax=Serendipita indica (strain DSM 11827) TaxID=1109443 RepID=G4U2Y3_SERID|nr:hypothetical protein PIIN_00712 [Serendipita indica DSM 11827]